MKLRDILKIITGITLIIIGIIGVIIVINPQNILSFNFLFLLPIIAAIFSLVSVLPLILVIT